MQKNIRISCREHRTLGYVRQFGSRSKKCIGGTLKKILNTQLSCELSTNQSEEEEDKNKFAANLVVKNINLNKTKSITAYFIYFNKCLIFYLRKKW